METQSLLRLDGFTDIGLRSGVDMRPTLLRILTDLYVQKLKHTPEEERHYTELALRLLEAVDVSTRVAVAERLASHLAPPLRVMERLAADLPEVAAAARAQPMLPQSSPGDEAALHHAEVLAAEDQAADERHAVAVPDTIDATTASELNELFFAANPTERRLILLNLEIVAPLAGGRIELSRGQSVAQQLEAAALARNHADFAHHLVHSLRIPREQARRVAADDLGEPVVVAGKALGIPRDALYRILLFVNPAVGHSVERVHALAALYDEITPPAAEGMVAIWQALQKNERAGAKYQPVTSDGEPRAHARAAAVQHTAPFAPAKAGTLQAPLRQGSFPLDSRLRGNERKS